MEPINLYLPTHGHFTGFPFPLDGGEIVITLYHQGKFLGCLESNSMDNAKDKFCTVIAGLVANGVRRI